ncbi:TetR/AcrR family transcriptional regulator C-terminal domain-containing protein [Paenibacillus sp. KQZ6P-2]|uniref:TetR/AcrR family transcriptional regulator C-terminal domain-containing protein n=1 Tax=Paenibacillus mangrovi TaxID=2931978 RepID=A0A9X1WMV2_9BACL|nr:TetR/AcrR family transcriptional regulator C-terminal domain-containing protein [Paenibacillus mangrovi]MCJ8012187.1 TetR/AcrR family transcriptional regulator C-terminal domain-containing protein [Paenibacillus mangrovi]
MARKTRKTNTPLDQSRIIQTALQLLDEIGLKELSMNKIANKLQVKTASLYYHVQDKDQLMGLLTDRISSSMEWPESSLPWREQLGLWGEAFRKILLSHRDTVDLFNSSIASGYDRLKQVEKLYALLSSIGFSDQQVPWVASILKNYVLGFVGEEVRLQLNAEQAISNAELSERYNQYYSQLPSEEFPTVIRLASYTTNSDWVKEFKFGLDVLTEGLAVKLR